jgi:hypothetical protein
MGLWKCGEGETDETRKTSGSSMKVKKLPAVSFDYKFFSELSLKVDKMERDNHTVDNWRKTVTPFSILRRITMKFRR